MDLSLTESVVGSQLVIGVRGEVDIHSAPQLRDRLLSAIDVGHESIIVDLSRLDFIDSTGLGALVAGRNHAADATTLRIVCSSERLLKLFRITGLDEVFAIYPSVVEATAAGSQGPLPSSAP